METGARFEIRDGRVCRTDAVYGWCDGTAGADALAAFAALEQAFKSACDRDVRDDTAAREEALRRGAHFWRCFRLTHGVADTVPAPLYFFMQYQPGMKTSCELFVVFDGATLIASSVVGREHFENEYTTARLIEARIEGQAAGAHGWIGCGRRTVDRRGLTDAAEVAEFVPLDMLPRLLNECVNFGKQTHLGAVYSKYLPDGAYPLTRMHLCSRDGPLLVGTDGLAVVFSRAARTLAVPAGLPACLGAVRDNEAFWWDMIDHLSW